LCFTFLFYYLGVTFFAGILVFIVAVKVNIGNSRSLAKYQKKLMKATDARVSATTECLNNIKMIKLYSWEQTFTRMIGQKRKEELSVLYYRMLTLCMTFTLMNFFP